MISFALADDQALVQATVHKFAKEVLRPGARACEQGGVSKEALAQFQALGLLDVDLDEGLPQLSAALIQEELGWGDPGAAVDLWSPHIGVAVLAELGTREQRDRLLARFSGGGARFALAYCERWKSRLAGFATTATPASGGYHLTGSKSFVANAQEAELTVLFAQLVPEAGWDGVAAFAIEGRPAEDDGATFRPGDAHGLLGPRALRSGELCFEEHFVPEQNRLRGGEDGDITAALRRLLGRAQLGNAARQVGLARAAYELALEYTQDRRAFGKVVAHFQAVAFSLADMAMDVDSARWLLWRAAAAADQGTLDLALCAEAAIHANEAAFRCADACVQLLGGAGYMEDFPAEKWLREAKALALFYGTDELHRQLLSDEALGHKIDLPSSGLQPFFT